MTEHTPPTALMSDEEKLKGLSSLSEVSKQVNSQLPRVKVSPRVKEMKRMGIM